MILLATADRDAAFECIQASSADIVEEPTIQPYVMRYCAARDPASNLLRVQERR